MRGFDPSRHIGHFEQAAEIQVRNGLGGDLVGVVGRAGANAIGFSGQPIGLDEITMSPGTAFDLHEHEGDHILYVLEGHGGIVIDDVLYPLRAGNSVFVPAEYAHGVTATEDAIGPFRFLAFGVPHHPLHDDARMRLVGHQSA
jgi:mannose-6-phosphate isomerase-like protein (cupin superfamily)